MVSRECRRGVVLGLLIALLSIASAPIRAQRLPQPSPVDDNTLQYPDAAEWLTSRRTPNGWGYSPLEAITRENVRDVGVVWEKNYPVFRGRGTPLVWDGVIYLPVGRGNRIEALDARTGELIWEYPQERSTDRTSPAIAPTDTQGNLAIYDGFIIDNTVPGRIVALDHVTGAVAWRRELENGSAADASPALVAHGNLVAARNCSAPPATSGCVVTAHRATSGELIWQWPPLTESETGVRNDAMRWSRTWTVEGFDADLNLAYVSASADPWATDTSFDSDGIFALNVDTGELVWEHPLSVDSVEGEPRNSGLGPSRRAAVRAIAGLSDVRGRRTVVTASPRGYGVVYGLDARTGEPLWQVANVAPGASRGGAARIDNSARALPCAGVSVEESWMALTYSPRTGAMYMGQRGTCGGGADVFALEEWAAGAVGPAEAGGGVYAISPELGETIWTAGASTVSVVPTGGGLLFGAGGDGHAWALNDETGENLWNVDLGAPVVAGNITFGVDNAQYLLYVTTSEGSGERAVGSGGGNFSTVHVLARPVEGSTGATAGNADPSRRPVYNAVFEPRGQGTTTLLHNQPTEARFYIGPPDAKSGIGADAGRVAPEILEFRSIELAVRMKCAACGDQATQTRTITYYRERGHSSEATFSITPDVQQARREGQGYISFEVWGRGRFYDRIVVDVEVVEVATSSNYVPQGTALGPFREPVDSRRAPDLHIEVIGKSLVTEFRFVHADEKLGLAGLKLPGGQPAVFKGAARGVGDFQKHMDGAYMALREVIDGYGQGARRDPALVLQGFRRAGYRMYEALFGFGASRELADIIAEVEAYESPAEEPLRILLSAENISVPWQLLHPYAPGAGQEGFWGEQFEIGVMPELGSYSYPQGTVLEAEGLGTRDEPVVLLRYDRGSEVAAGERDVIQELSDDLTGWLGGRLGGGAGLEIAARRGAFFKALENARTSVPLVLTFTHGRGASGYASGLDDETVIKGGYARGPLWFLSAEREDDAVLGPGHILEWHGQVLGRSREPLMSRRPIVLLNACESGPAGEAAMWTGSFVARFFALGARAVVATEAPVAAISADAFVRKVLQGMIEEGRDVVNALFVGRRELLGRGDPMGLLYSYFGNPEVVLRTHPGAVSAAPRAR